MTHRMNFDPSEYARSNYFQARDGLKLIKEISFELRGRKLGTVLDLGCGPGTVSKLLYEELRPQRLVAFDFSPGMIEQAKKLARDAELPIEFVCANAAADFDELSAALKLDAESVDLVFSNYCIHWIPRRSRQQLVANIERLLKPGSDFYLLKYTHSDFMSVGYNFIDNPKWSAYLRDQVETKSGYKVQESNLEEIIGFIPYKKITEDADRQVWTQLFVANKLFLESSVFCHTNFRYQDLQVAYDQFNQAYWRPYVGEDRLEEFNRDYKKHLMETYIEPKIEQEAEIQATYGHDAGSGRNKLHFNYVYTVFHGKKLIK